MKRCWSQTRWHFQLTKGFDIYSPVTLAGGTYVTVPPRWSETPLHSWQTRPAARFGAKFISLADHSGSCGFKLKQETLGWIGGGFPSVASAEGKWAITTARMGRRTQQQRIGYLEPCGENIEVLKTWNIRLWGTKKTSRDGGSRCFTRSTFALLKCSSKFSFHSWQWCSYLTFISNEEDCGPKRRYDRTSTEMQTDVRFPVPAGTAQLCQI